MKRKAIYFFLVLSPFFSSAQNKSIDSLRRLLQNDREDSVRCSHFNDLCWEYKAVSSCDTAFMYADSALQLSNKIDFKRGISEAYSSMGNVRDIQADFPAALDFYIKALKIDEEQKDKRGIATRLGNIGNIYIAQGDYEKSRDYMFRALELDEQLGNKTGVARHLSNIGNTYYNQQNFSKALEYYFKALKIDRELGRKSGIDANLGNIGVVYKDQGNYPMAEEYFFKAMKVAEELNDKYANAIWLDNLGSLYTLTKKYSEAEKCLKQALALSDSIGDLYGVMGTTQNLSELYEKTGKPGPALDYYKKSVTMKDSIFNKEKDDQITRKEMNYEFEKKEAVAKAKHDAESKQQQIIIWCVAGGLLMVLLFAGFIARSLRETRKQKNIIEEQKIITEHQKHLVEEKQKESIDSITYAKRLQEAILPPQDLVRKHLSDSFILYKPKDIVAGDFYWMEVMETTTGKVVFIAAADCTGHGVPGAMVSVVCSNALNRAAKEFGLRDTGKILDKVSELVIETFEKSDENVKDGMDISLLKIEFNSSSGAVNAQWSGAHNSLFYVHDGELVKLTADKQPVGKHDNRTSFTTQDISLERNTIFYLFSDGYADQFGGPSGKKLMSKAFKNLLLVNSNLPMREQKDVLSATIEKWQGSREQVDDILVIGIKV